LFVALASIYDGYGVKAAEIEVEDYLHDLTLSSNNNNYDHLEFDPLYFFLRYLFWKIEKPNSKSQRLLAADALAIFKSFPTFSKKLLNKDDNLDELVAQEDNQNEQDEDDEEDDDDDDDDLEEELPPDAPEVEWRMAQAKLGAKSAAMDKLMAMVGLRKVKESAMVVYKRTLVDPFRPKDVDSATSMNFLFVGNPGTGKTTVAELLAAAMVELKFRKNPKPLLTSASKILKLKDPAGEFEDMIKQATGGTIFIDEVYLFKPAPPGQQANASNQVIDTLLEYSESLRGSTSFILAGYKEDVERLLTFNDGFPSRFPKVR
jgi:ATP-dependent Clp protease ATP-binding subunit ClpA